MEQKSLAPIEKNPEECPAPPMVQDDEDVGLPVRMSQTRKQVCLTLASSFVESSKLPTGPSNLHDSCPFSRTHAFEGPLHTG